VRHRFYLLKSRGVGRRALANANGARGSNALAQAITSAAMERDRRDRRRRIVA
jgi:hypothetical protein